MQPHCCYGSPAAIGETGHPELKLVPFVAHRDVSWQLAFTGVGSDTPMRLGQEPAPASPVRLPPQEERCNMPVVDSAVFGR